MIIADLETNGLWPNVSKIHCAVLYNTVTDQFMEFTPANIDDLPLFLHKCPALSFHNGIAYDLKVLEKVAGFAYMGPVFDTLIASRILWPDLEGKAPHSVESWGERFGIPKPEHEDWDNYSEEMLHRCKQDVIIQSKLYKKIIDHVEAMGVRDSRITNDGFWEILKFEQEVCSIIEQQGDNGWAFDLPLAYELVNQLTITIENIEKQLFPRMPIKVIQVTNKETKAFNKDGSLSANAKKWLCSSEIYSNVMGDFSKVKFEKFNIRSSGQVKDFLLSKGWIPKEWNYKKDIHGKPVRDEYNKLIKTSPQIPKTAEDWDEVVKQINYEDIKLLAEYNKASHRWSQIQGFIDNLREDHRIEARAISCSTNTQRMVHRVVVNVPKAKEGIYYGKEMRSLFIVPEGKVLVGVDACALEARVEAHYIYPFDKSGAEELIHGDIHSINADVFGVDRDVAKGGKYALTYGCSAAKLAKVLSKPNQESDSLYTAFWEANPGLKRLKEEVEKVYEENGYLLAIDGRPLTIRYKHALINTLFQSAGSIIMKRALVLFKEGMKKYKNIKYLFVGNFHDEFQIECFPEHADFIGRFATACIEEAGKYYNMNVLMKGEYKRGKNWGETH